MAESEDTCPVGREFPRSSCTLKTCQYSIRGNCEFLACQAIIGEERRERRLQLTSDLYEVTVPDLQSSAQNVMIAILLNGFFEHVFSKPILDCTKSELETLRNSEELFYKWRNKERPRFAECLRVLDLIELNL